MSVPLGQRDITDDTSSTSIHASDQDIDSADNNSDVNESQSININSINLNNHASNDCESPSGSDSIGARVRAKNSKVQKKIHRKSQHFTAWNRTNTSSSESLSYEY